MASVYDFVDTVLNLKVPDQWKEASSGFYVYSILNKVRDTPDSRFEYTVLMEVIMAALQGRHKNKIAGNDLKALFRLLIKLHFLALRITPHKAAQSITYLFKYKSYYKLDNNDILQGYYAAFPPALTKQQVKKMQHEVDSFMFILTVWVYNYFEGYKDEKLFYLYDIVEENFEHVLPILLHYGYKKYTFGSNVGEFVADFIPVIDNWLDEDAILIYSDAPKGKAALIRKDKRDREIVLTKLSDGSVYQGPRGGIMMAEQRVFRQRAMKTLTNIKSGVLGAIGYGIGGDKGSDIGAICDNLLTVAGQTYQHAQQVRSIQPASTRPNVTDVMTKKELEALKKTDMLIPAAPKAGTTGARLNGPGAATVPGATQHSKGIANPMTETKGTAYAPQKTATITDPALLIDIARKFYPRHSGAVGQFIVIGEKPIPIKSGEDAGAVKGTAGGGIPRGQGYGFTGGGASQGNIATHVEGHSAAIMWQRSLKYAQLVVSEPPCKICSRVLPSALPPGARLDVTYINNGQVEVEIFRSNHGQ